MTGVYLSYAQTDVEVAERISRALTYAGYRVLERVVEDGRSPTINQALANADVVVVLWTSAAATSAWVGREIAVGALRGRLLIAGIDARAEPPPDVTLRALLPVADSPDTVDDEALRRLLVRLSSVVRSAGPDDAAGRRREVVDVVDVVVIAGRREVTPGAALLGALIDRGVPIGRCWGSGVCGAPLAAAMFLGYDGTRLRALANGLRQLTKGSARRSFYPVPKAKVNAFFDEWFGRPPSDRSEPARPLLLADLDRANRPADWLQLVVIDLRLRRPSLLPRALIDMGRDDLGTDLPTVIGAAMGGVDVGNVNRLMATAKYRGGSGSTLLRTVTIPDSAGIDHEFAAYPLATIPWSMAAETPRHTTIVFRPTGGPAVSPDLEPEVPPRWRIVDLPLAPDEAASLGTQLVGQLVA
jgi:TIR domain